MSGKPTHDTPTIQSLDRGLAILEAVAASSHDYILGPTAWRLSRRYGRNLLETFFHQFLRDLTETLEETPHLMAS
jgi:DNA-binding IclR family transcriptional regulator